MGKQLVPKVSKQLGKRANSPGSGTSRGHGRGTDGRPVSIVETEVNKLNRLEAQAASLAAAEADKATTARSTKSKDIQQYLTTQEDKTGHEAPRDPDQDPPDDSSSSGSDEDLGEKDKAEIDSVSITTSQAIEYERTKSYLSKDNVKLLSKFNKDGRMRESLINRIQLLTAEIPISFCEFETDHRDQEKLDLDEAFYCLGDRERNVRATTSCVQAASTYLASSGENVLYLLAHNTLMSVLMKVNKSARIYTRT
jgi:hypothetical protein